MGFSLEQDGSAASEVRRIVGAQLDAALRDLARFGDQDQGGEELIHDARKRMKKVRAVLRLVRGAVAAEDFEAENGRLRDAGRRLAPLRDAQALAQLVDELQTRAGGTITGRVFAGLREGLGERERAAREQLSDGRVLEEVSTALQEGRGRVSDWALDRPGFALFADGLRREYRSGRRRMRRAHQALTDPGTAPPQRAAAQHDWRKRSKGHWYHVRLLAPSWPAVLDARVGELDRLADLLGADYDLAVLDELADELLTEPCDAAALRGILDQRQRQLRAEAHLLGRRLYAGKPGGEVRMLRAAYGAWASATPELRPGPPQ